MKKLNIIAMLCLCILPFFDRYDRPVFEREEIDRPVYERNDEMIPCERPDHIMCDRTQRLGLE